MSITMGFYLPNAGISWITPAGSLGSINYASSFTTTLIAYDHLSTSLTYSVTSGTLPLGLSLTNVNGRAVISGTTTVDTTALYTFVVTASSGTIASSQTFTIQTYRRLMLLNSVTYYDSGRQSVTLSPASSVYPATFYTPFNLYLTAAGAAGSTLYTSGSATFGYGGVVNATFRMLPGASNYNFVVGNQPTAGTGGYPGGGTGVYSGSGGGGFSGFWQGTTDPFLSSNRGGYFVVGGAGAGHSNDYTSGSSNNPASTATYPGYLRAGDGGYQTGTVGNANAVNMVVPTGGTQTAGGTACINNAGSTQGATAGQMFYGGSSANCGGSGSGGAGGAGWYGGGGGCGHCGQGGGAGGGGSSYYNTGFATSVTTTNAANTGGGYVTIVLGW